jgi:hypothetical protein
MAVTGSAPISITDLVTEFGGSAPHSLTEYYRGGSLVPDTAANASVPTSGAISLTQFYGAVYLKLTLANGSDNWANFVVNGTTYSRGSASKSGTTWTWGNGTAGTGGVANPYPSVGAGDRISIAINV